MNGILKKLFAVGVPFLVAYAVWEMFLRASLSGVFAGASQKEATSIGETS